MAEQRADNRITLDINNMTAEAVGEHGITRAELDALAPLAAKIHDDLTARRNAGTLPFYDLPSLDTAPIKAMAEELKRFDNFVLLGIGGSALGPIALHTALNHPHYNLLPKEGRGDRPRMFFLDNVDPDQFNRLAETLNIDNTVFAVVTKSGGTAETMAQFMIARKLVTDRLGEAGLRDNFVCITDPAKGNLRKIVDRDGIRCLEVPPAVGGRFTVFTSVGLLPAAVSGIDIDALLAGAADMRERTVKPGLMENPAYLMAAAQYLLDTKKGKKIAVIMPYSQALKDIADWFRQMWAESLGKKFDLNGNVVHTGQTPVKALGTTDQHSQVQLYMEGPNDKTLTFLRVEEFDTDCPIPHDFGDIEGIAYLGGKSLNELINAEQAATEAALVKAGRPCARITFPRVNAHTVGQALYMMEVQTVFAGGLYNIDPLDQPGVEEGKLLTYAMMGRKGYEEKKNELEVTARNTDYIL